MAAKEASTDAKFAENQPQKVQASLDTICPKCGKAISPAEVRRVDFERIECPECGERFAPINEKHGLSNRQSSMP
jgi:hypothetical protein